MIKIVSKLGTVSADGFGVINTDNIADDTSLPIVHNMLKDMVEGNYDLHDRTDTSVSLYQLRRGREPQLHNFRKGSFVRDRANDFEGSWAEWREEQKPDDVERTFFVIIEFTGPANEITSVFARFNKLAYLKYRDNLIPAPSGHYNHSPNGHDLYKELLRKAAQANRGGMRW